MSDADDNSSISLICTYHCGKTVTATVWWHVQIDWRNVVETSWWYTDDGEWVIAVLMCYAWTCSQLNSTQSIFITVTVRLLIGGVSSHNWLSQSWCSRLDVTWSVVCAVYRSSVMLCDETVTDDVDNNFTDKHTYMDVTVSVWDDWSCHASGSCLRDGLVCSTLIVTFTGWPHKSGILERFLWTWKLWEFCATLNKIFLVCYSNICVL